MRKTIAIVTLAAGAVFSQTAQPAAKVHVKSVNGTLIKYTTKLKQVVELNFTLNYHHNGGKSIIDNALVRIGAAQGFTVKKLQSAPGQGQSDSGTARTVPNWTIDDLKAGQVIVANNISGLGGVYTSAKAKADAIQEAIEVHGVGYLGVHGSGDQTGTSWPFLANTLHPVAFVNHANQTTAPVYKHIAEAKNIVLQGILETKVKTFSVPNEVVGTTEQVATGINGREMKNEWYQFNRQIADDPAYKPLVTMLLKYDGTKTGGQLPTQYIRKGGNMYTWVMKAKQGLISYIPAGHDNTELLDATQGFDGGSGDYDRYMGQLMMFLAGYTPEVCAGANCAGLPMVDSLNRLTGTTVTIRGFAPSEVVKSELNFTDKKIAFYTPYEGKKFEAKVVDMHGRVVAVKTGKGEGFFEFDQSKFKHGVYVLSVKVGSLQPKFKRYAFLSN